MAVKEAIHKMAVKGAILTLILLVKFSEPSNHEITCSDASLIIQNIARDMMCIST